MKVREFMNREVVTLRPEDPAQEAARLLVENSASALPVVNNDGSLVGMLTEDDLLIRLRKRHLAVLQILFPDGLETAHVYQKAVGTKVKDGMGPAPAPVDPETSVESAADRLEQAGTRALPVVEDGRLVGMVSCRDLVKAVAETAAQTDVGRTNDQLVAEMKARLAKDLGFRSRHSEMSGCGCEGGDQRRTRMKVREFMNREVVTLRPEDSIQEGARLLTKNCTSALPVINGDGSIVGMLTEDDLLIRLRKRHHSWWETLFTDGAQLADEYRKVVGSKVKNVMRPTPAPVGPETSLETAAEGLEKAGTGLLPVPVDGQLVGTVSYRDLVAAVAESANPTDVSRTDDELVAEMKTRLNQEAWVSNRAIWIAAKNGVLTLFGLIDTEEEKTALGVMAQTIPGCKGVENNLFPKSLIRGRGWV
jgi:CBS domain-containing protein